MNFLSALLNSLPGAAAQGLIWGLMAIGVYITFRILDVADLTVDGSIATGGAAAVMLIRAGMNPWLALLCAFACGMLAGFVTGMFHIVLVVGIVDHALQVTFVVPYFHLYFKGVLFHGYRFISTRKGKMFF